MMKPFDRKKVINRVITICHQTLSPYQFERNGRTWKRITDEHALIINLQKHRKDKLSNLTLTFNLGVFFPAIYLAQNGSLPDPPLEEVHCCPRERIGHLFFKGDKWWTVNRDTIESEIASELTDALTSKAVPWLLEFQTMEDVFRYLRKRKRYFEATIVAFALSRDDTGQWLQKALSNAPHDLAKRAIEIWARDHNVEPVAR